MGHSVTLGGERVGSGKKNKIYLHNYERSTHDLSEKFMSTMGVGMLVPFMCKLATRDDKFEIDLEAGLRTIPTKGPLFGSMKLQLDVYECPLRLYQALLHNNPRAIGLNANQVKWPKMRLYGDAHFDEDGNGIEIMSAENSLVKYLGISGIGTPNTTLNENDIVYRDLFAAPLIAYFDIFKNYYANKQEENAYQITQTQEVYGEYNLIFSQLGNSDGWLLQDQITKELLPNGYWYVAPTNPALLNETQVILACNVENLEEEEFNDKNIKIELIGTTYDLNGTDTPISNQVTKWEKQGKRILFYINRQTTVDGVTGTLSAITWKQEKSKYQNGTSLTTFELKEIDDLRMKILSEHTLGQSFLIDQPGSAEFGNFYYLSHAIGGRSNKTWQNPLAGICVKTYQSDIFNNWINTEWIDGENGINAITAISTSDGEFTIDVLQFQEKLYNLLNRVAVSDGTYYGYLDAAYTESDRRFCETPMWIGGMSDEIIFEEIVQTAPADGEPLGTLGGRGNLTGNKKGGKITVKVDEPTLIIGIVSITPRIQYTQGNEWFMTELDNLQDIHVPALDGIGFQNLIAERMHAGAVILNNNGTYEERAVVGKIPAWLEYMTSYDRAFGDFLNKTEAGDGYMIFNRDYLCENGELQDATTYIDPSKYNYAFAYTKLDAQNFWVKITSHITARRLMSARQIPTA